MWGQPFRRINDRSLSLRPSGSLAILTDRTGLEPCSSQAHDGFLHPSSQAQGHPRTRGTCYGAKPSIAPTGLPPASSAASLAAPTPAGIHPSRVSPHMRPLPSAGITRLPRHYWPLRHPAGPNPSGKGDPIGRRHLAAASGGGGDDQPARRQCLDGVHGSGRTPDGRGQRVIPKVSPPRDHRSEGSRLDWRRRCKDGQHRARLTLRKRLLRKLQRLLPGRTPQWRDLLLPEGGPDHHRRMAAPLQHRQAT